MSREWNKPKTEPLHNFSNFMKSDWGNNYLHCNWHSRGLTSNKNFIEPQASEHTEINPRKTSSWDGWILKSSKKPVRLMKEVLYCSGGDTNCTVPQIPTDAKY
jgi:hypothetical protein